MAELPEEPLSIQKTGEKEDMKISPSQNEAGSITTATEESEDTDFSTATELLEQKALTETGPDAVFDRLSTLTELPSPFRYIEKLAFDQDSERIEPGHLPNSTCEMAIKTHSSACREEISTCTEVSRSLAFPGNSEKLVFVDEECHSSEFERKLCGDQGLYRDDAASPLGTRAEGDTEEIYHGEMEEDLNHGALELLPLSMANSVMTDFCRVSIHHASNSTGKPWHQEGRGSLENGEGKKSIVDESQDSSVLSKSCGAPIQHDSCKHSIIVDESQDSSVLSKSCGAPIQHDSCKHSMSCHREGKTSLANGGGEMGIGKTNDIEKPLCRNGRVASPKAKGVSLKELKECMMEVKSSGDGESLSLDEDDSLLDDNDDDEEEQTDDDDESIALSSSSSSEKDDTSSSLNLLDNEKCHEMEVESECKEGELKVSKKENSKREEMSFTDDGGSEDEGGLKEPIRSKHEMKHLPHVPKVSVALEPYHKTVPVGVVSSVVGVQLIVEGKEGQPPLNEGSILWITDQRSPLGIIDELFGPVKKPFYVVRYNDAGEVPGGAKEGVHVSYVRDFADFVLNNPDLYTKGCDIYDEERSDSEVDFSDDEKEAEYKRSKASGKRGNPDRSNLLDNDNMWNPNSRRVQGQSFKKSNNNRRMRGENTRGFQSNNDFSGRSPRNQNLCFQHHQGEREPQFRARVEPIQASEVHPEQPPGYQFPAHQQTPSQQFPSLGQPQPPGPARQARPGSEGIVTNELQAQQLQMNQPHVFLQTPLQQFPEPSHPQMPSHPEKFPAQRHPQLHRQVPQVTIGYGIPMAHQLPLQSCMETMQSRPASMQHSDHPAIYQPPIYQRNPPLHQFSSSSQHQLSSQAIQVSPNMRMPSRNQIQAVNADGYPLGVQGVQAAALAFPVVGIPAGQVNIPFNYPSQIAYDQSFLPSASNHPSALVHQGPTSAGGVPEHLRPTQPPPGNSAGPWQQHHTPQDGSPHFFDQRNQRRGPHQGKRF